MSEAKIQPMTITKPMQLLAAWLVGLLTIDSCFLIAATRYPAGSMESSALTWAAIFNVPIFLGALFLLQTRFRPELQEDLYYSTYINQKTNQSISITRDEQRLATVLGKIERIENLVKMASTETAPGDNKSLLSNINFGINESLEDKEILSAKLLSMGVKKHTWFGVSNPPDGRVISISQYLTEETREAILSVAEKLGFTRYNLFDNQIEEIEEDVLIGSYGSGARKIPRTAS